MGRKNAGGYHGKFLGRAQRRYQTMTISKAGFVIFSNCRERINLTNLVSYTEQLVLGAPPEKILRRL